MSSAATKGLTLAAAARELGVDVSTVRRWVERGAPCEMQGAPGRGNGARVDLGALRRWRAGEAPAVQHAEWLGRVADALLAFHREQRWHRMVRLTDSEAAALYHTFYVFLARRVGAAEAIPAELATLEALGGQR